MLLGWSWTHFGHPTFETNPGPARPEIRDLHAETSRELPSMPSEMCFERFPSTPNFWEWMRV